MLEVCIPQEAHHGMGWVAVEHKIILYVDDGHIAGRKPIWFKMTLTVVVRLFKRVLLLTNPVKTKSMVCTPGFIW